MRLSANQADWERTIITAWTDHVDTRYPFFLHYVEPVPDSTLGITYVGHILLVQLPFVNYAAFLLTALPPADEFGSQSSQVAVYSLNRLSASSASTLVPHIPDSARFTTRVRRGRLIFPQSGVPRVGDGDHITVEFIPFSEAAHSGDADDDVSLLQTYAFGNSTGAQGFRAMPSFLTHDPYWCFNHKIEGTHDPPTFVHNETSVTRVHRRTRGIT